MTYLSDRFFLLLGTALVVAVASLVFPVLFTAAVLLWPILAVITLLDLRSLPRAQDLSAEVRFPQLPELTTKVALDVKLLYRGGQSAFVKIGVKAPELRCVRFPLEEVAIFRGASDRAVILGRIEGRVVQLGHERLEELTIVCHSLASLWVRHLKLPIGPLEYRAIPSQKEPPEQTFRELVANQRLLFQGSRRQMRSRSAELFHSVRKYQSNDSIRHLDHRKIAKYGELMTRVYDSFYDHHLVLGMDLGRSLLGDMHGSYKYDYYLAACLALARNALKAKDRVSFFAFSQKVHHTISSSRHPQSFAPLFRGGGTLRPREEESNFELVPRTVNSLAGQRSIVLLFTDGERPSVQAQLRRILPGLAQRHLVVVVGLQDETYAINPLVQSMAQQPFSKESYSQLLYGMWISKQMRVFQEETATLGAGVLAVGHGHWLGVVTRLYSLLRDSMAI